MSIIRLRVPLTLIFALVSCTKPDLTSQSPAIPFSSVISFGDSLSDAGSYQVGMIRSAGGGLFTINGIEGEIGTQPVPSYTWAQLIAAAAIGEPSCAARVGGFGSPISREPASDARKCRNYAQGGARVSNPKGIGNPVGVGFIAGPLTEPVVTQIEHFAVDNGSPNFAGTELITLLAGPNDLFAEAEELTRGAEAAGAEAFAKSLITQLAALVAPADRAQAQAVLGEAVQNEAKQAGATAVSIISAAIKAVTPLFAPGTTVNASNVGRTAENAAKEAAQAYAATVGIQTSVAVMAAAAETLAQYVKDMIGKGASYLVVVNIPDVSQTPLAAKNPAGQPLFLAMTSAFNTTLEKALAGLPEVVLVDAFSENQRQFINPAHYDLDNVKDVACDLNFPANVLDITKNGSGSAIVCNGKNLIHADTSRFLFADNVHPTPYGHKLLAQYVTKAMVLAGWL